MAEKKPKVFISYSHDSEEHKERVLNLSDKLCDDGIDCELDQVSNFSTRRLAKVVCKTG